MLHHALELIHLRAASAVTKILGKEGLGIFRLQYYLNLVLRLSDQIIGHFRTQVS
jgi:hypothetical protein